MLRRSMIVLALVLNVAALQASGAEAQTCSESQALAWSDALYTLGLRYAAISGAPGEWVQMAAATGMAAQDPCDSYVQSEAWVIGGGDTGVVSNWKGTPPWAVGVWYGSIYGTRTGQTKHWYIYLANDVGYTKWKFKGSLERTISLGSPRQLTQDECWAQGWLWDEELNVCQIDNCPLVLSLHNGAYRLTTAADGVVFDVNATGSPHQVGWTERGSDDAFLALDRNANGLIDDGSELFGTGTTMSDGKKAANGFAALADLDAVVAAKGRVDESDPLYDKLLLWIDRNHNGVSESSELYHLREKGVTTIYLSYREAERKDGRGNFYRYAGRALVLKNGIERARTLWDVVLAR